MPRFATRIVAVDAGTCGTLGVSPVSRYYAIPFGMMGVLCVLSAIGEYLYPFNPRPIPKAIYGLQIVLALSTVLAAGCTRDRVNRLHLSHPIPVAFTVFFLWLMGNGLALSGNVPGIIAYGPMCVFWYSMFLFFYVAIQVYPSGFRFFVVLLFLAAVIHLSALRNSIVVDTVARGRSMDHYVQNYGSYNLVVLFPFMLLLRSNILKACATGLTVFACMYSFKRGATVTLAVMALVATVIHAAFVGTGKRRVQVTVLGVCMWLLGLTVVSVFCIHNPERVRSRVFEAEGGSAHGRMECYVWGVKRIGTFTVADILGGKGLDSFHSLYGGQPHNDFLLLLHDYGLVSLLLMISVYFAVTRLVHRLCKCRSAMAAPLAAAIAGVFCLQMFSYGIFTTQFGYLTGMIGLVAGATSRISAGKTYAMCRQSRHLRSSCSGDYAEFHAIRTR